MIKQKTSSLLLIFSFLLCFSFPLYAQLSLQTQQILIPKKVYIGDTAELRCSFNSDLDLFKSLNKNEIISLSADGFTEALNTEDYELKKIDFYTTNTNFYTLSITFVPWKTGTISLPAYNVVNAFCSAAKVQNKSSSSLIITLEEINIVSITKQNAITSPKESLLPLLIPGTTYKIYALLILFIILIIGAIEVIVKHQKLSTFIKNQKLLRRYRKNQKQTIKALSRLESSENSDKEIAEEIQKLMRKYLSVRFDSSFINCVSSQIIENFTKVTSGLASEKNEEALEEIAAVFVRTDFIRYSHNSYGKTKARFNEGEKIRVLEGLIANIIKIESPEVQNV